MFADSVHGSSIVCVCLCLTYHIRDTSNGRECHFQNVQTCDCRTMMSINEIASDAPRFVKFVDQRVILNRSHVLEVKSSAKLLDLPCRASSISRRRGHVVHLNLSVSARTKYGEITTTSKSLTLLKRSSLLEIYSNSSKSGANRETINLPLAVRCPRRCRPAAFDQTGETLFHISSSTACT